MANWYFEPGEQRAARVNELFTGIATRYDLLNDLQSLGLHRRWKRRLIALAGAKPGLRALDLCCGTGDLAFALARRGADVAGLDFSQAMLQVAQRKKSKVQSLKSKVQEQESGTRSQESGIGIVSSQWSVVRSKRHEPRTREYGLRTTDHGFGLPRFIRADALRIPFRDNAFDIVTVGYGLRNLANWERGLCEMQRVAK